MLIDEICEIAGLAEAAIEAAKTQDDLDTGRAVAFGRKSRLAEIRRSLAGAPAELRPALGKALGDANRRVEASYERRSEAIRAELESGLLVEGRLDLTLPGRRVRHGHSHLISRVIEEMCDVFTAMGYRIASGPEVETDWYNFEALNIPAWHPARSEMDTLYVDTGYIGTGDRETDCGEEPQTLLRTHTSPVQIRLMESTEPPLYHVMPGRVFRNETVDATHAAQFHQIEGLAIDSDITFGDMAGTIEYFCHEFFGPGYDVRLFPDFFPFTEPSAGLEVWWKDHWLEIAGCGMVDPNVLGHVGYDPEQWQGFAWGFGIERVAMLRYGIDDIRHFYNNDVRLLEQFT